MLIKLENAGIIYDEIIKRTRKTNGKVVIFVGFDIDSICSLRILVNLLRSDNIIYEIIPVMDYVLLDMKLEELRPIGEDSIRKREVKAFVMINCGGTRDMSKKWFNNPIYKIVLLLVDVHRPTHHNNIHAEGDLIIVDDEYHQTNFCPTEKDINSLAAEESPEEENFYEESDEESVKVGRIKKKKEALDTIEEEKEEGNDHNEDEVDHLVEGVRIKKHKKSALRDEKILSRKVKEITSTKIKNYYSGNYFGSPSCAIFYKIATQKNREDSSTLWLSIVSLTEHYLQYHISQSQYEKFSREIHTEVISLNSKKKTGREGSYSHSMLRKSNSDDKETNDKYDYSDVKVKTQHKGEMTITVEPDYRLCLYRHWNLFDSFLYSEYTVAHLNTWKEEGKADIKKIFTLVGVPLDEAKCNYTYMRHEYKEKFKEKILSEINKFDLKEFMFHSFLYQFDSKTQLSASDFVYILSSLLENPSEMRVPSPDEDEAHIEEEEKKMRIDYKYDNFWSTYDFLSFKKISMVKSVIETAIKFQTILVANVTKIIDSRLVSSAGKFWYANVTCDIQEKEYFMNSISLEKLSLFVLYTHMRRRLKKEITPKPLVFALENKNTKTHLVAGVLGDARQFEDEKNQFAIRFRLSADAVKANIKLESFNDCIIEIASEDFLAFLNELIKE